jgi:hypothetical protein
MSRRAPVQTFQETSVPWEISAEAWKEYAAQGHGNQSHERVCERGGWGVEELAALLYRRIKRLEALSAQPEEMTCPACQRGDYCPENDRLSAKPEEKPATSSDCTHHECRHYSMTAEECCGAADINEVADAHCPYLCQRKPAEPAGGGDGL